MKGECLCKSVVLEIEHDGGFEACHCGMCRQWGGGPFLGIHTQSYTVLAGHHSIGVFSSSDWAERGFCTKCGTHLFYHLKPTDEYTVPLGLFQAEEAFEFREQIFIDRKPSTYAFSNPTGLLTEQQVFEKFGA